MSRLIILEGADGSGKTTLALDVATRFGANYVHHGPYPGLTGDALARRYAVSALPAVLDESLVVMDRCWISEMPYGLAFRGGADRLGETRIRTLERLVGLADVKVYLCLPPWEIVRSNWVKRKGSEYLKTIDQLRQVYDWYDSAFSISWLPGERINPFDGQDHAERILNDG
jgi:thymidylate kinase